MPYTCTCGRDYRMEKNRDICEDIHVGIAAQDAAAIPVNA